MDYSLTRRGLIAGAAAASLIRPRLLQAQTTGVTPVFIKWDAWYDNEQIVTQLNHHQLSPARWQFRAPWFCKVLGTDRITCAGTQADVDIEIQAAANAGIKAWAYVWYGGDAAGGGQTASLFKGWQLHQSSTVKDTLKWCGYIGMEKLAGYNPYSNTAGWQANCNIWANDYFKRSNYLKVGGRPVVFVAWHTDNLATHFAGSTANCIASFNYLRSQSVASGAGNPYIISTGDLTGVTSPTQAKPWITGDAVSSYTATSAMSWQALPHSAADFYTKVHTYWASFAMAGNPANKVVPIAMLGWDKRPRIELPDYNGHDPWVGHQQYYTRGTNAEVVGHVQDCINFIGANQPSCDSKIMWVYAWNEASEGGTGGVPTLGDPPTGSPPTTALLSALKPVLTAAA